MAKKRKSYRRSGAGMMPMVKSALVGLGIGSLLGGTSTVSRVVAGGASYMFIAKGDKVAAIAAAATPEIYGTVAPITQSLKGKVEGAAGGMLGGSGSGITLYG